MFGRGKDDGKKSDDAPLARLSGRLDGSDVTPTVIAPGARLVGDLEAEGDVRVAGRLEGTLRSEGQAVVAAAGHVHGDVVATTVVVAGVVEGSVRASRKAHFVKGCRVEAGITGPTVSVEDGAVLSGRVQMGERPASGSRDAPAEDPSDAEEQAGREAAKAVES